MSTDEKQVYRQKVSDAIVTAICASTEGESLTPDEAILTLQALVMVLSLMVATTCGKQTDDTSLALLGGELNETIHTCLPRLADAFIPSPST
jgi:hypothetical protein